LLPVVFFLVQCAQPGSPGGGPKDTQPPQIIRYTPDNFSTRFSDNKFKIDFDEFIALDNINQKLLISPPMDKLPDFKVKGKSLLVKFNEGLKENTTYTLFFGDAIVDITEKNSLLENSYVFSTGDKVDSMSMSGTVIQAIDLQPAEDVFVMLYKNNNDTLPVDSLPLVVKPFYLSKTNEKGKFTFNGLADEEYFIFALRDMNSNHIFDQPSEEIAFLDTLVQAFFTGYPQKKNTDSILSDSALIDSLAALIADTLLQVTDTVNPDTLEDKAQGNKEISYDLFLFKNRDSVQRLLKAGMVRRNTLEFAFSLPAREISLVPENYSSDSTWYLEEYSVRADTVRWYLKNIPLDTLELSVMSGRDTLEYLYINLNYGSKSSRARAKKEEKKKKIYLEWSSNVQKSVLKPNQQPKIRFEQPLESFTTASGSLIIGEDTTYRPKTEVADSFRMVIFFPLELQEETNYSYYFPDSSFIDWNGYFNKEIRLSFATKTTADYGKLTMHMQPEKSQPYIFQMLDEKGNVVNESYFESDTTIRYVFVNPAKYKFKLIFDNNGNKQWDSGYYPEKIEPEQILFYTKEIELRANWEIEETWKIK